MIMSSRQEARMLKQLMFKESGAWFSTLVHNTDPQWKKWKWNRNAVNAISISGWNKNQRGEGETSPATGKIIIHWSQTSQASELESMSAFCSISGNEHDDLVLLYFQCFIMIIIISLMYGYTPRTELTVLSNSRSTKEKFVQYEKSSSSVIP